MLYAGARPFDARRMLHAKAGHHAVRVSYSAEVAAGVRMENSLGHVEDGVPSGNQGRNPGHYLHENIVTSMCPRTIFTVGRVRRFARGARDYRRAYLSREEGEDIQLKEIIERMKGLKPTGKCSTRNLALSSFHYCRGMFKRQDGSLRSPCCLSYTSPIN